MTVAQNPLFKWQKALRESDLQPSERLVALTLATYMDARGAEAFPSVATLARNTGLCERAVRYAIRTLEAEGWLATTQRRNPRGDASSNRYVAQCPTLGHSVPHHVDQSQEHTERDLPSEDPFQARGLRPRTNGGEMKRGQEEPWGDGIGEDTEVRPAGKRPVSAVTRLRQEFTQMFGGIKAPLYSSVGKMLANIKWMLDNGYDERTILGSFQFFEGKVSGIGWSQRTPVWDEYFKRKTALLQQAAFAQIGSREGTGVVSASEVARRSRERTHAAE